MNQEEMICDLSKRVSNLEEQNTRLLDITENITNILKDKSEKVYSGLCTPENCRHGY